MDDLIKRKGQLLTRFLHILLALIILASIIVIYFSVFTNDINGLTHLAVATVIFEGVILFIFKGKCPVVFLHKVFGDEQSFFDLFLPKKLANYVSWALVAAAFLGVALLIFQ